MQYQDIKPTTFSDPSSHWRNETNAFDASLTSFADNQPKPKIPNYVQFSGQTINLGAYEAMSLVRIDGNNLHFRTDIGWRDVQRLHDYT